MRRAPLVSSCAVVALAVAGLAPAATAGPAPQAGVSGPSAPGTPAAAAAQRTLDAVESAFDGSTRPGGSAAMLDHGRDLTLLLRDLRVQLPALGGADRARAEAILARPTDGAGDVFGDGYKVPAQNDCGTGEPGAGSDFCVHWVRSTDDAPSLADTNGKQDGDQIPDQVEDTRATLRHVWAREVGVAGYKAPLTDAGPPDAGPNKLLDVYLADIGADGYYGYCVSEPAPGDGNDEAAYCVLDNDYASSQFPANTALENLQVTVAHEFFHAIQFAYDAREDVWFLEGTATWMEDEVYDDVNDNRFYLRDSPLTQPGRSLDKGNGGYVYGTWLWWRYLAERFPGDGGTGIPTVIRKVWEAADDSDAKHPGTYSLKAVRRVLTARDSTLTTEIARFAVVNRQPRAFYEEGGAYDAARLAGTTRLSAANPSRADRAVRLDHLASATFGYTPGSGLATGGWRLHARVDAPTGHNPAVRLTAYRKNGTTVTKRVALTKDGVGAEVVSFDSDTVRRVELALVNAGHRYTCNVASTYSCSGRSKDEDRRFTYRVRLTRS